MGGTCWSPVPVTRASVTWSGTPLTAVWSSVSPTRSRRRGPDVQDQHARRAGAEAGRGVQGRVHGPRAAQGSAVHLGHARAVPRHDPVRTARAVRADPAPVARVLHPVAGLGLPAAALHALGVGHVPDDQLQRWVRAAQPGAAPHPRADRVPDLSLEAEEELFGINKYGGRYAFSFEAFLNDEYQVIQTLPGEMANSARDTEDVLTTGVLATEDGPNPAFFNTGWDFGPRAPQGNIFPDNPPLTMDTLQEAVNLVAQRTLGNGTRPVRVRSFVLVVPPSLELTANTILAQANIIRRVPDGSGGELETTMANPLRGRVRVVVNEWLPILDTSDNSATTWYLLPDGAGSAGNRRPAIITTFMSGREAPELRISGDTGRYIGGGEVPGTEGSFLNDDVQYRVRHITGAAGVDPSGTLVSDGSGEPSGS